MVIKTAWHRYKDKQIHQRNRISSRNKKYIHTCEHLIFKNLPSQFSEENIGFSTSDSGATGYLCAKINNWFTSCITDKNKHNMSHRLKDKIKDNNTFGQKQDEGSSGEYCKLRICKVHE